MPLAIFSENYWMRVELSIFWCRKSENRAWGVRGISYFVASVKLWVSSRQKVHTPGLHIVLVGCAFTVLDMFWNTCYARRQIVWENSSQGREMERNMDLEGRNLPSLWRAVAGGGIEVLPL